MRVLVTGSSGLIGRVIAVRLEQLGHDVIGLSRRKIDALPGGIPQIEADIGSPFFLDSMRKDLPPCEIVIHAASERATASDAISVSTTNCLGTQQVIALARTWSSRAFLFLSGVAVIGVPRELPVTEEHPTRPLSAYLASKLFGEHLVEIAGREGLASASFRIAAPIGPAMPGDRIAPVFVERALAGKPIVLHGTGSRRQDYVHVRDVACAAEQWIVRPAEGVFNVASGRSVSNLELAERCIGLLGSKSRIEFSGRPDPDDAVTWEVSIAKAESAFGYRPAVSLDDSIREIAEAMVKD